MSGTDLVREARDDPHWVRRTFADGMVQLQYCVTPHGWPDFNHHIEWYPGSKRGKRKKPVIVYRMTERPYEPIVAGPFDTEEDAKSTFITLWRLGALVDRT